jgi:hypothetical protein
MDGKKGDPGAVDPGGRKKGRATDPPVLREGLPAVSGGFR